MEATPCEQVLVVAVATNCAGELTVSPFDGFVTTTVANVQVVDIRNIEAA
jgi:hypothetical protein